MKHTQLKSSMIYSAGYENEILEIKFNDGSIYQYFNVLQNIFYKLLNADSHGQFFWQYIRNNSDYKYEKVA